MQENKKKSHFLFGSLKIKRTFASQNKKDGAIAQLVEQRTENPCVPGSIPGGTTVKRVTEVTLFFFVILLISNILSIYRIRSADIKQGKAIYIGSP